MAGTRYECELTWPASEDAAPGGELYTPWRQSQHTLTREVDRS
jgi:hypothetical protein